MFYATHAFCFFLGYLFHCFVSQKWAKLKFQIDVIGLKNSNLISHTLQSLRPALISVRDMCYRIGDMNLCRFDKDHTYHLKQFQDAQMSQLNEVRHYY